MRSEPIRELVAGVVLISFVVTYLAMEWTGREPDSVLLLGAVAIAVGAGYYLWPDGMDQGVDAAQEFQGGAQEPEEKSEGEA